MKTRNTGDLAERAARLWLGWNPTDGDPVGCPANVADAVTEWAEALIGSEAETSLAPVTTLAMRAAVMP